MRAILFGLLALLSPKSGDSCQLAFWQPFTCEVLTFGPGLPNPFDDGEDGDVYKFYNDTVVLSCAWNNFDSENFCNAACGGTAEGVDGIDLQRAFRVKTAFCKSQNPDGLTDLQLAICASQEINADRLPCIGGPAPGGGSTP